MPSGEDDVGALSSEVRGQHIPHPQGAFDTTLRANGTGCRDGSWEGALSADGETFTITFSAYEAKVSPGQDAEVKDCTIDVDLGSREGTQFSVGSFYYQGYVFLEKPGMSARQTANYKFPDFHQRDADKEEMAGPVDTDYLFTDEVAPVNREWTRCRRRDSLRIKTRLMMKNDAARSGEGYINTSAIDGSLSLRWALKWRRCQL
jgi:hypothetical protein